MEQLTLEQAAEKHMITAKVGYKGSFMAGAQWQKEQYKHIKEALELGREYMRLYQIAKGQNSAAPVLPGSALDRIQKALELLQD